MAIQAPVIAIPIAAVAAVAAVPEAAAQPPADGGVAVAPNPRI